MSNVITATFEAGSRFANATPFLWQWDYGQQLQIEGLELPTACQVHFSNLEICGFSVTAIATDGLVEIPNELLTSGQPVYAFIYLHTAAADGETEYRVTCYVNRRPQPVNPDPTPGQQDSIDQAIAALNSAVEQTGQSAADAAGSADAAAGSALDAEDSATLAESWAVGGTGTRDGEDYNNSRFYAEVAQQGAEKSGYAWFDVDDQTGQMMVTITDNLAQDVIFAVNENLGTLEVTING